MSAANHPRVAHPGGVAQQRIGSRPTEMREHFLGDRQPFGLAGGGAGGQRIERAPARPQDVGFAAFHALDGWGKLLVGLGRHAGLKSLVAHAGLDAVGAAECREGDLRGEFAERALLCGHGGGAAFEPLRHARGLETGAEDEKTFGQDRHRYGTDAIRQSRRLRIGKRICAAGF